MKFGFFTIIPFHESDTEPRLFHETLERIELVDQLGFDEVWIGEHHFSRHGLVSGVNTWMGAIAARTKRVRIGTAITILPFHNPIMAAEEAGNAGHPQQRAAQFRHRQRLSAAGVRRPWRADQRGARAVSRIA